MCKIADYWEVTRQDKIRLYWSLIAGIYLLQQLKSHKQMGKKGDSARDDEITKQDEKEW